MDGGRHGLALPSTNRTPADRRGRGRGGRQSGATEARVSGRRHLPPKRHRVCRGGRASGDGGHGDVVDLLAMNGSLRGSERMKILWRGDKDAIMRLALVDENEPCGERRLRGGGAHGNVILVRVVVFGANAAQRYHAFIKLTVHGNRSRSNSNIRASQKFGDDWVSDCAIDTKLGAK